ncbi:hypothetical protein DOTSEDRAFT_39549 [Dothistroma septosporum NZE10]|uniref:F-box domain-containing protein n=1 Tax=Dothistroma septosporum (strain NZE10 / CBS 128990) TaxID=675120 RepID=N1PC35_DOTSN|nr:hypothetical protein DOTSEDRAFT_39549 [Dothistroma septosporum NZE10]
MSLGFDVYFEVGNIDFLSLPAFSMPKSQEHKSFTMADFEKSSKAKDCFTALPSELQLAILENMNACDLAMMSCASKHFQAIVERWENVLTEKIFSQQRQRLQQAIRALNYNFSWKPADLDDLGQHLLDCLIDFDKTYHVLENTKHNLDKMHFFTTFFMKSCRLDVTSTHEDIETATLKKGPLTPHEKFLTSLTNRAILNRSQSLEIIIQALACDLIRHQRNLSSDDDNTNREFAFQPSREQAEESWAKRQTYCPTWTQHFNPLFAQVGATRPFHHSSHAVLPLSRIARLQDRIAPFTALPASAADLDETIEPDCEDMVYVSSSSSSSSSSLTLMKYHENDNDAFKYPALQQAALMESAEVWHSAIYTWYASHRGGQMKGIRDRVTPLLEDLKDAWQSIPDRPVETLITSVWLHPVIFEVEDALRAFGENVRDFVVRVMAEEGEVVLAGLMARYCPLRILEARERVDYGTDFGLGYVEGGRMDWLM